MAREEVYNTKQKDLLLKIIKNEEKEFTIKDIYNKAKEQVGLTTIYRYVEKLENMGRVSKSIGSNNLTYYQYLEECDSENHFYLKCEKCGKMEHVDCDCITDLNKHILNNHQFKINKEHIIINGICKNCGGALC